MSNGPWADEQNDLIVTDWGRIASLIETCKISGAEPFASLKPALAVVGNGHPQSRIDEMFPWTSTA